MNLNFSEMKKQHKQALVLGALWMGGILYALWHFVLAPFFADRGVSAGELEELREKIHKAQMAVSGEERVRKDYNDAKAFYGEVTSRYIVPESDPVGWLQGRLYTAAREVGVGITSISAIGGAAPLNWDRLIEGGARTFRPYTVRVVTECSYSELIALVGAFERSNPYLWLVGITMSAQDQNRLKHNVVLTLEIPMWGKRPKLTMKADGSVSAEQTGARAATQPARARSR